MIEHDQHAKGRTTLVVSLASAGAHRLGKQNVSLVGRALMERLNRAQPGRYDLLTIPDDDAGNDPAQVPMLSAHIASAAQRHGIRRVIVALGGSAQHLADQLADALPDINFYAVDLARFGEYQLPLAEHVAVACMDWRMHGAEGGLLKALEGAYGHGAYSLLTMAGGAKWAADPDSPRGKYLIQYLAQSVQRSTPLTRIHLLCHMDCGGYGGDDAFPGREQQIMRLKGDLRAASLNVREAVRIRWGVQVTSGIVALRDGRVSQIIPA